MKAEYRQAIQLVLGNSGRKPQLRERDSGEHTVATTKEVTSSPTQDTPVSPPPTVYHGTRHGPPSDKLTANPKHRLLPIV